MSVIDEPSGRRFVQVDIEVPGTPEEVWQAIATEPGISSWLVPTEFEEQDGKPVAVKMNFGPGMESRSEVKVWDPPFRFFRESACWAPGAPNIMNEWSIEARAENRCVLHIATSLMAHSSEWDCHLEAAEMGWSAFLRTLELYLTHFRALRSTALRWMIPVAGPEIEAWKSLTTALGLKDAKVGDSWTAPAGVPHLCGVVELVSQSPFDLLVRIESPVPAIAAFGAVDFGGQVQVGLNLCLYGELSEEIVAREKAKWETWLAAFVAKRRASSRS